LNDISIPSASRRSGANARPATIRNRTTTIANAVSSILTNVESNGYFLNVNKFIT